MPFTISKAIEQDLNQLQLANTTTGIRVKILPDYGALLHEFSMPLGEGRLQAVSSYKNLSDLLKNHSLSYRSAKLSPFPCRIPKGQYQFEGKAYEFKNKFIDGSAIHGILFNKPFTIVLQTAGDLKASVLLEYVYKKEDPGYPFDFKINVKYTLKEYGLLSLDTTVTNLSSGRIPLADGWHPYFSLGGKVNDWLLTVEAKEILAFDENLIPTGKRIPFDRFSNTAGMDTYELDHCFVLEPHSGKPACVLSNPANRAELSFFPGTTYPYLQIYTPEDRNSIAIENLSAAPNCFNNGIGLIILEPGHSQSFTVQYQLGLQ
jgi:aldose 1-epimerase